MDSFIFSLHFVYVLKEPALCFIDFVFLCLLFLHNFMGSYSNLYYLLSSVCFEFHFILLTHILSLFLMVKAELISLRTFLSPYRGMITTNLPWINDLPDVKQISTPCFFISIQLKIPSHFWFGWFFTIMLFNFQISGNYP